MRACGSPRRIELGGSGCCAIVRARCLPVSSWYGLAGGASALPAAMGGVGGAQARAAKKYRTAAEYQRISGSDSGVDTAAAQASAALLRGIGAELAVAGAGDCAGQPEAGSGAWVGVVQALAGCGESCGLPILCYGNCAIFACEAGQSCQKLGKYWLCLQDNGWVGVRVK